METTPEISQEAAREMLAALNIIYVGLAHLTDDFDMDPLAAKLSATARAAIARAEGR